MTIKAHPTFYKGIRFRSRLEAKWAAFFDQIRWDWTYEPLDLKGYTPDFILTFPHELLAVEVKPELTHEQLNTYTPKIEKSGWQHDVLLVGARLFEANYWDCASVGLLGEHYRAADGEPGGFTWGHGLVFECQGWHGYGVCHEIGSYHCRHCGAYDGNPPILREDQDGLKALFKAASNITQWRPEK